MRVLRLGGLGLGLALATAGGVALGFAWIGQKDIWWPLGTALLLAGMLAAMWGAHGPRDEALEFRAAANSDTAAAPLLGEMLVKVHLISPDDLKRALARQRGSSKRLGKILVEMGVITYTQLAEVLEEQFARRDEPGRTGTEGGPARSAENPSPAGHVPG
jgi:hypothetical protein